MKKASFSKNIFFICILFFSVASANNIPRNELWEKTWIKVKSAFYLADDSSKVLPILRETEITADSLNDLFLKEQISGLKGKVFGNLFDNEKALKYYRQALVLGDKRGKKTYYDRWLYSIAIVLENQAKHSHALDTLRLAENYAKQMNYLDNLYRINLKRFNIYFKLSQYDLALLSAIQAKSYSDALNLQGPYLAQIYEKFGDVYRVKQHLIEAIKNYSEAIKLESDQHSDWDSPKAYVYTKLGRVYHSIGQCEKARDCYSKALYYAEKKSAVYRILYTLIELSVCHIGKKEYDQAKSNLEKMARYKLQKKDFQLYSRKYELLGDIFQNLNNQDSATYYYKKAIATIEKERKKITIDNFRIGLFKFQSSVYLKLASIYKNKYLDNKKSNADSVFKYINLSRSRTLYDFDNEHVQKSEAVFKNTVNQLRQIQRDLRLSRGDSILQTVRLPGLRYELLTRKMETIQNKIHDPEPVSINEFQEYLQTQNASALIYSINEWDSYVLFLNGDSLKFIALNVNPYIIKKSIKTFVKSSFYMRDPGKNSFNAKSAYELYQQLWLPIEQQIDLPRNIIIVPDIPILSLPFDVLLSKSLKDSVYTPVDDPKYKEYFLAQQYNIGYLPSPFVLTSFSRRAENNNFLAVANPTFDKEYNKDSEIAFRNGWDFEPLIFSKVEVNKSAPFFENSLILEQEMATKQNFLSNISESNIIHLATHAFVDSVFDAFSGLVFSLSADTLDDGLLMGYEIDRLKLNSDLVVLSACESGQGQIVNGEGVMGMPRLFFNAGVRTVLMALWKVDDKIASKMMPLFYKNLIEKGMTKMEALGETKRTILNSNSSVNYAFPFYWASFNLYGDTGQISSAKSSYLFHAFLLLLVITSITLLIRKYRH